MWSLSSLTRDSSAPPAVEVQSVNPWAARKVPVVRIEAQERIGGREGGVGPLKTKQHLKRPGGGSLGSSSTLPRASERLQLQQRNTPEVADVELGKLLRKGSLSHKGQWEAGFDRLATGSGSSGGGPSAWPTEAYLFFFKFIYLLRTVLGFHCCMQVFSSFGEQGLLFCDVFLTAMVSPVAEHRL